MVSPEAQLAGAGGEPASHGRSVSKQSLLMLGALGVVFGDIGTSPLYAMKESLRAVAEGGHARAEVIGITSLLVWAIIITVTIKYVILIMSADNKGEGGTLSLMALAQGAMGRRSPAVFMLGIAGAALFYGDAIITPAISVLSAVEGLTVIQPSYDTLVLPIALAILVGLFMVQARGTGRVATYFGPIMLVWFAVLALLGLIHIADDPEIFACLNPVHGILFLGEHGLLSFAVIGSVVLAITGGEALYADMGHFGKRPIRLAWSAIVLPSLLLNYLGQGAFVLSHPYAVENPFFLMAPGWASAPLVLLATVATVIASQAVITGAFSLTRQAIQLGLLPRLRIRHTSDTMAGQIYMPGVNALLFIGVILLALAFRSSSALASAYGIAVTGAMAVDTALIFIVARRLWHWSLWAALGATIPLMTIDLGFFFANLLKFAEGGYMPLLLGFGLIIVMWTWARGTAIVREKYRRTSVPLRDVLKMLKKSEPHRVTGTAVFLTSDPEMAPSALMHNLKHNRVLHKQNVMFTVRTSVEPRVPKSKQVEVVDLGDGVLQVIANVGYMETPDVPKLLQQARKHRRDIDPERASYFLAHLRLVADPNSGMPLWQDRLYIGLTKFSNDITDYFRIPTQRAVELGTQLTV